MNVCIAAEALYEKDPKIKGEDVKILQDWLCKQPHLPKLEESQVITFLHSCYYSIELTKTTIDKYFTRRTLYPDIFRYKNEQVIRRAYSVRDEEAHFGTIDSVVLEITRLENARACVEKIKKKCHFSVKNILPKKTPEGNIIFLAAFVDFKPENYNFINEMIAVNCVSSLHVHKHGFDEGLITVFNLKGITLGHMARGNLPALKHVVEHFQEGLPVRLKQIHFVGLPPFMDKILGLVKPMMSNKLFDMIQLHSSFDDLYEYVPKECLPEDYGGKLPSCKILIEETVNEILENLDFYEWHDSQVVDESRRLEPTTINGSSFSVDGTFKKLQID